MIFQGTAIPNLIIEIAGIMICLFALLTIWYGSRRYTATKRYMTGAFGSMLAYKPVPSVPGILQQGLTRQEQLRQE